LSIDAPNPSSPAVVYVSDVSGGLLFTHSVLTHEALDPDIRWGDEPKPEDPRQAAQKKAAGEAMIDQRSPGSMLGEGSADRGNIQLGDEGFFPEPARVLLHFFADVLGWDAQLGCGGQENFTAHDGIVQLGCQPFG
jgi:hypothetical protein